METESLAAEFFESRVAFDLNPGASSELLEGFLRRLRAPTVVAGSGWWKTIFTLAFPAGAVLGVVVYLVLYAAGGSSSAPSSMVVKTAVSVPSLPAREENLAVEPEPPMAPKDEPAPAAALPDEPQQVEQTFWQPLQQGARLGPGQYRKLLDAGWIYLRQARYAKAAVAFGRAVHLNHKASEGYYGLALAYFEQGMENEALAVIEQVTGRQGGKADLWLLRGTAYQFQGDEAAARKAYGRYLKLAPTGLYARDVRALLARKELPRLNFE
jgi:tetratricopeptide (TPR) repeat protein